MSFLPRVPLSLYYITILLCFGFMLIDHVDCQTIGSSNISCIDSERRALFSFKKSLVLNSQRNLSSWSHENMDCCRWEGIRCNQAGHVVAMDLHCSGYAGCIRGEISPSLLQLSYLNHLDLSYNAFTKIPEFVGSLKRLRCLNLSNNYLTGKFPYQLGNLSVLETLDLGFNFDLQIDSLSWVSRLTKLEYLDMSGIGLESAQDWLQSILKLPSLASLYLRQNDLPIPPTIQINGSTSLEVFHISNSMNLELIHLSPLLNGSTKLIDLSIWGLGHPSPIPDYLSKLVSINHLHMSGNYFGSRFPDIFSNLSNLITLDLSYNGLEGIPESFSKLSNLITLDLSGNYLEGIPESFSNLSNLIRLDVSGNMLNKSFGFLQSGSNSLQELRVNENKLEGTLPNLSEFPSLQVLNLAGNQFEGDLAQLLQQSSSNLIKLDVSSNHFSETLTEAQFRNLTRLKVLILSYNSLTLSFSTGFTPPFQLETLRLRDCKLGKIFPHWLRTQHNLTILDISNSGISDTVPSWFWNISHRLITLNVSHNSMTGSIPPNSLPSCQYLDLSSNRFNGTLPSFSKTLYALHVSNNSFSGGLTFLCGLKVSLRYVDLSTNFLSGILPNCFESLGNTLMYLDLSNNFMSGILPNSFEPFMFLNYLNLDNNKFTGSLPNSIGNLNVLEVLRLRNNSFSGKLSQSLKKCSRLFFLDLGENHFSGTVPDWIGTGLTRIHFLRLRSNKFDGNIPSSICHLNDLHILDLSFNNLSGSIPSCLNNITGMSDKSYWMLFGNNSSSYDDEMDVLESYGLHSYSARVLWKGIQMEYKNDKGMEILRYIDLSSNRLSGSIPEELTSLVELNVLSLSHNVLIGPIPNKIGQMRMLETLDLSHNLISGVIPPSMVNLSTLNYLDLSYNNLTGRIPVSTQLSTMNATMFLGNQGLCGDPLPYSCHEGETGDNDLSNVEGGDDKENMWMYISIALGFIVGFWGVCGTLLVKHSWAQNYFQFLTHIHEMLHVAIMIGLAKLRRRFTR